MRFVVAIFTIIVWSSFPNCGYSQCMSADFILPEQACRNENILVESYAADNIVEWDFCSGELHRVPIVERSFELPGATGRPDVELVKRTDEWYGFVTGTWTNSFEVLHFKGGPGQPPSDSYNFGNLNGQLNNPGAIQIINEGPTWYAIIHNSGSGEILKVTFGDSFFDVADVVVLVTDVGYVNSGMALGKDSTHGWVAVISEPDNTFTIIRLGDQLIPPGSTDIMVTTVVPNPNNLGDVDLINVCGEWFAGAVNLGGGNSYLLSFGSSLFSIPQIDQIASLAIDNGARLRFAYDGGEYFLFIASLDGIWNVLSFGSALHTAPILNNYNDLNGNLHPGTYALSAVKENSDWTILTVDQSNGAVYRIMYPQVCSATPRTSKTGAPVVSFGTEGTFQVSLQAIVQGMPAQSSKVIEVLQKDAPDFDFQSQNVCAGHAIYFETLNSSGDISDYQWHFGDEQGSSLRDPQHVYATAGDYAVTLEVTASNLCRNFVAKQITVFPEPESVFAVGDGLICTNQSLIFTNETIDVFKGLLTYEWFVDGTIAGTSRDLNVNFTSTGSKTITLKTFIPGCADEFSTATSPVQEGVLVDFEVVGACQGLPFLFESEVSAEVVSYTWNLANEVIGNQPNPSYIFPAAGEQEISLTVTNSIGCENVKTKIISVHSSPLTDFSAAGPPTLCAEATTSFSNLTTNPDNRPITHWLWQFNDPHNTESEINLNGQHLFTEPGTYPVSLTATTEAGCTATIQKDITILPSPSTAFTVESACEDLPTTFTAPADDDIQSSYWEIGTSYSYASSPTYTFPAPGDYRVYAEFYGSNGCISTREETVHVPVPLRPDFSVTKNCAGYEAIFTDVTSGADPVATRHWHFPNTQPVDGSPIGYTFSEKGEEQVTLQVIAESGCTYETTKTVTIADPPSAEFDASTVTGAYPLEVTFTNLSANANSFLWGFMDGSGTTSTEESPYYTFSSPGSFDVQLTAYNSQACDDTFTKTINVVAPLPDADIEAINLINDGDGAKLVITVHNKGNTVLKDLVVTSDFAGSLSLQQVAAETIMPSAKYNVIFNNTIITPEALRYVCGMIHVENDLAPEGNRVCAAFQQTLLVVSAYPNPAQDWLYVEWIVGEESPVTVTIQDAVGRTVLTELFPGKAGLNSRNLVTTYLPEGLYLLTVATGTTRDVRRLTISHTR